MGVAFDRYQKRRLITSYFWVVISIFLVLFLLGLQGLFVLNAKKVADYFKEQIALTIYLKDTAKEVEIKQLENTLAMAEYTKSATFISKDEAAAAHSKDIGENFIAYLGENPLQNSIDVYLKADFVDIGLVEQIANDLAAKDFVEEVTYDKPLVGLLNDNVQKISFWALIISAVFIAIAVLLINSSIRLSIYAHRFTIKTMQMVGATKGFIRKPFVWKSVRLGIMGAVLAIISVGVVLYYVDKSFPQLGFAKDYMMLAILAICILALGILITLISTWLAAQTFLNLKTDDLYY